TTSSTLRAPCRGCRSGRGLRWSTSPPWLSEHWRSRPWWASAGTLGELTGTRGGRRRANLNDQHSEAPAGSPDSKTLPNPAESLVTSVDRIDRKIEPLVPIVVAAGGPADQCPQQTLQVRHRKPWSTDCNKALGGASGRDGGGPGLSFGGRPGPLCVHRPGGHIDGRTTRTGQAACRTHCSATEPSSSPAKPPRPR